MILSLKNIYNQAPEIEWQNTIGGSAEDIPETIEQTKDGGYIIGGSSYSSISGDKTEDSKGADDFWILKLDSIGNIEWQRTLGGESLDRLYSVHQTSDLGFILGGYTSSDSSGDKTEDVAGFNDYWVMKLDSAGNIEWQNAINAIGSNYLYVMPITTGGYLAAGCSNSDIAGDKTEINYGGFDFWILKLNNTGEILWQKSLGGESDEWNINLSIHETKDNGFILGGSSISNISGLKTDTCRGGYDYWILKLDSIGNILWQKTIGGNSDDYLSEIIQVFDGGYLLSGTSSSDSSAEKLENNIGLVDDKDFWILKLNKNGDILWQNTIGGSKNDVSTDLVETYDFGYLLGGHSSSDIDADKTEASIGGYDYWILKLDSLGDVEWQKTLGGSLNENFKNIFQTTDGGFTLIGSSTSGISGNKLENSLGGGDFWVLKLNSICTPLNYYSDADSDGHGTLTDSIIACAEPVGYSLLNDDCNDLNSSVYPSATEVCNLSDDNCNGLIDDGIVYSTLFLDADSDEYGNIEIDSITCLSELNGYVFDSTDCNDLDNSVHPGSNEILNMIDDNCNGIIDEGLLNINEKDNNKFVNIYPNPNNGNFSMVVDEYFAFPYSIKVFDDRDKTILIIDEIYEQSYHFSFESHSSNFYIIQIVNKFFTVNKLIIILN